jgi:selenocysteine-specific elongation factor
LGAVVPLEGGLWLHAETLAAVQDKLRGYLAAEGQITVAAFRDLIQGNRKYALALLTYFDSSGVTQRQGDVRVLLT